MTRYYKFTGPDGAACHGGKGTWRLGRWRSVRGLLLPCEHGLHILRADQLPPWAAEELYEVEVDGELIDAGDKLVARRARTIRRIETWNERTARLFAADCAEHALPIFEAKYPNEDRPRKAIEAARAFADGRITSDELDAAWAAARDAAWDAARAAARDAARAAAWAAADAARDAARAAAWAAWAAAGAAGGAAWAAWAAERTWQADHLIELLGIER